jgi:hypothetical protein
VAQPRADGALVLDDVVVAGAEHLLLDLGVLLAKGVLTEQFEEALAGDDV